MRGTERGGRRPREKQAPRGARLGGWTPGRRGPHSAPEPPGAPELGLALRPQPGSSAGLGFPNPRLPRLLAQLAVHVGLDASAKAILLERRAKNHGYRDADVRGFRPARGECLPGGPEVVVSGVIAGAASKRAAPEGVAVAVSGDAGRYVPRASGRGAGDGRVCRGGRPVPPGWALAAPGQLLPTCATSPRPGLRPGAPRPPRPARASGAWRRVSRATSVLRMLCFSLLGPGVSSLFCLSPT
ncbi:Pyroglutamyl-peptidase 1-like protein [Vulpes lagopus]